MRRQRRLRTAVGACAAVVLALSATADARRALTPALGDWEGTGPHGLPLSFTFVRERVRIAGRMRSLVVMRDLVVSYPTVCAPAPDNSQAFAFPTTSYTGPGAPPVTFRFHNPKQFNVYIGSAPGFDIGIGVVFPGHWLSARRGVLSAPNIALRKCGWPKKTLTWQLRPAKRTKIATGEWSGIVTGPEGVTGSITATVGTHGRTVDRFDLSYTCGNGGSDKLDFAPAFEIAHRPTSLFVSAAGSFAGTKGAVNGVQVEWSGTFGADGVLRGTFTDIDACNDQDGALMGTFTARATRSVLRRS
jgi:hypothetical protein